MTLGARAWLSLFALGLVMAALVFVPAGTIDYWQAWVYLALFLGAGAAITAHLLATDRELLERRMRGGPTAEQRPTQRLVMLAVSLAFVALLVVPALDRRFGWSRAPVALVLAADALVAARGGPGERPDCGRTRRDSRPDEAEGSQQRERRRSARAGHPRGRGPSGQRGSRFQPLQRHVHVHAARRGPRGPAQEPPSGLVADDDQVGADDIGL